VTRLRYPEALTTRWADAELDCTAALKTNPVNAKVALTAPKCQLMLIPHDKALWRRGIARTRQEKLKEARTGKTIRKKKFTTYQLILPVDLEAAQKLEPGNGSIEDELARLQLAEKKAARVNAFYFRDNLY